VPALPVDRQFRYAAGIQCDSSKDVAIGAAYTLIDAGTCKIDETGKPVTGDLVGKYDPNLINSIQRQFHPPVLGPAAG